MATERISLSGKVSPQRLVELMQANAAYDINRDADMAANYIVAVRAFLSPATVGLEHVGERMQLDARVLQDQLTKAEQWLFTFQAACRPPEYFVPGPYSLR